MTLPCEGQTIESIYEWAQGLNVGDDVAISQSHSYTMFEYRIAKVEQITDPGSRVHVSGIGSFYRSKNSAGKNCMYPKGQTMMIEPTEAVRDAAETGGTFKAVD